MELESAKKQFISTWGNFGSQWGINRSMAQVHGLLLCTEEPLSTETIMKDLSISRGNANMNIRELLTWNIIYKVSISGDRKEFFRAEKDMWEVAKKIVLERKRRELDPLKKHLSELKKVDQSYESIAFVAMLENIERMVNRFDTLTSTVIKAEEHFFFQKFKSLFS